jgi:hypothetical protein
VWIAGYAGCDRLGGGRRSSHTNCSADTATATMLTFVTSTRGYSSRPAARTVAGRAPACAGYRHLRADQPSRQRRDDQGRRPGRDVDRLPGRLHPGLARSTLFWRHSYQSVPYRLERGRREGHCTLSTRSALLIANGLHHDDNLPTLPSAVAGARSLANVLKDRSIGNFNARISINPDSAALRVEIGELCRDSRRGDTLLISYSGHGLKDYSGRLHLATMDTRTDLIAATSVPTQFILDQLGESHAKSKVLLLDCSYSGAVVGPGVDVPRDILIITSSGAVEYAFEETGDAAAADNLVFASALVDGLSSGDADLDADGLVSFDELFSYVQTRLRKSSITGARPRFFNLTDEQITAAKVARHVFIRYNRVDVEFASSVANAVRDAGHKVWMDTNSIPGGDDWRKSVGSAIDSAKLVIVILTPEAIRSPWVRRELEYADSRGRQVLPIVRRSLQLPSWFALQFGSIQRIDLSQDDNPAMSEIASSVQRLIHNDAIRQALDTA